MTGLRIAAQIELATLPNTGPAHIRVYGLSLSHMNQLSSAGLVYKAAKNSIVLTAGDDQSGMATVFKGNIIEAYPDFSEAPEVFLAIFATPNNLIQLKPVKPNSFPGATSASVILGQLAQQAGLQLENNGVNTMLASPYLPGTVWQQINTIVRAADCFAHVDANNSTLAIWPKNGSRSQTGDTFTISPENGMISYPTFQEVNMTVRTLFDPVLATAQPGKVINVKSQLTAANGSWTISKIDLNLESQEPGGPWEMSILATNGKQGGGTAVTAS